MKYISKPIILLAPGRFRRVVTQAATNILPVFLSEMVIDCCMLFWRSSTFSCTLKANTQCQGARSEGSWITACKFIYSKDQKPATHSLERVSPTGPQWRGPGRKVVRFEAGTMAWKQISAERGDRICPPWCQAQIPSFNLISGASEEKESPTRHLHLKPDTCRL